MISSKIVFVLVQSSLGYYHELNPRIFHGLFNRPQPTSTALNILQSITKPTILKVAVDLKNLENRVDTLSTMTAQIATLTSLLNQVANKQEQLSEDVEALQNPQTTSPSK